MTDTASSTIDPTPTSERAATDDVTRLVDIADSIYAKRSVAQQLWWDAIDRRPLETRRDETPLDAYLIAALAAIDCVWERLTVESLVRLHQTHDFSVPVDPILMAACCLRLDVLEEIHRAVFLPIIDEESGVIISPEQLQQLAIDMLALEGCYMAQHITTHPYRAWLRGTIERRIQRSMDAGEPFTDAYVTAMRVLDPAYIAPPTA